MSDMFDLTELSEIINEFVIKAPRILEKHPLTSDLALQVERLVELSETPFTLAVVGQMRVGKSYLMNALVGEELAVVGVNETTATINYFKHGEGEITNRFRVHWKDKPYEDFELSEIKQWVGESKNASNTKYIEFFNSSKFFKQIYLVDTPGTGSVLKGHSGQINNFLAEKLERETLHYGGKADAILYVSSAVANMSAEKLLEEFKNRTRLPGSSPYNSMAVIHKWETLNVEDPVEEAQRKAALIQEKFSQYVSAVLSVSAPLALATIKLDNEYWNELTEFTKSSDQNELRRYLARGDKRFKKRISRGAEFLERSGLPWACFSTVINIALKNKIVDGEKLKSVIRKASGIDDLLKFIKERFISRTRLIKSFTILNKALEPCRKAQLRLHKGINGHKEQQKKAENSVMILEQAISHGANYLEPVFDFIKRAQEALRKDLESCLQIKRELSDLSSRVQANFEFIDRDIAVLHTIDQHINEISHDEIRELRTVLGCYGFSIHERVACYGDISSFKSSMTEERIDYWRDKTFITGREFKKALNHVITRLEQLAWALDTMAEKQVDL